MALSSLLVLIFSSFTFASITTFEQTRLSPQAETVEQKQIESDLGLVTELSFNIKEIEHVKTVQKGFDFHSLKVNGLNLTSDLGAPRLPFRAIIVPGKPSEIEVSLDLGAMKELSDIIPEPAQKEACRCEEDQNQAFSYKQDFYNQTNKLYRVESYGEFRGIHYSRVLVTPIEFVGRNSAINVYPQLKVSIVAKNYSLKHNLFNTVSNASVEVEDIFDYLIIMPSRFEGSLDAFIAWKKKLGHKFKVVSLESIGTTNADIANFTKAEYAKNKYLYAMIVGNEKVVPTNYVQTSGSSRTPSDAAYFIMGGADDFIPDVFHSRLVVENPEQVKAQVQKWIEYEQATMQDKTGFLRGIGIASNEGKNPSDNQYILSIQDFFQQSLGAFFSHFYENSQLSKPEVINESMNKGAYWFTYMGHGDGVSWPSTNVTYSKNDIASIDNALKVKPVIIDVACQNGKLLPNHLGERMVNSLDSEGRPIGAVAYYGGSVNISWHPPAIMAKGMAHYYFKNKLEKLGETIFAGHQYLAENYSNKTELIHNYRWYHLFGDPSLRLRDAFPMNYTDKVTITASSANPNQYIARLGYSTLANKTLILTNADETTYEVVSTDASGVIKHEGLNQFTHFFYWIKNKGLGKHTL